MPTSPTNWYQGVPGVDERSILTDAMRCDRLQGDTNGDGGQGCGYRDQDCRHAALRRRHPV